MKLSHLSAALLLTFFAVAACADEAAKAPSYKSATPGLKIKTLDDRSFDLSEHRGHWVVVNFWATWCAPCLKEIPEISAFDKERDDVDVIGLAFEDIEDAELKEFVKAHPASYPIAKADVYDPPKDFDTPRGLPTTYLIGPDGKIAKRFLGPVTKADLQDAVGGPKK